MFIRKATVGAVYPAGYSNITSMVTTQDGINPKDLLSNPFPTGQLPAIGNSQGLSTLIGQGISFVTASDRVPKFHDWHFDLQRGIGARSTAADYSGRAVRRASLAFERQFLPGSSIRH